MKIAMLFFPCAINISVVAGFFRLSILSLVLAHECVAGTVVDFPAYITSLGPVIQAKYLVTPPFWESYSGLDEMKLKEIGCWHTTTSKLQLSQLQKLLEKSDIQLVENSTPGFTVDHALYLTTARDGELKILFGSHHAAGGPINALFVRFFSNETIPIMVSDSTFRKLNDWARVIESPDMQQACQGSLNHHEP